MDAAIEKILNKEAEPLSDDDFVDGASEDESSGEEEIGDDLPESEPEAEDESDQEDEEDDDDDHGIMDDEFGDADLEDDGAESSEEEGREDEDDGEKTAAEPVKKGFLEGGKADTFARAFTKILTEQPKVSTVGAAPILTASKSLAKRKAEDAAEAKVDREAKKLRLAMKRQGHLVPKRRGEDPTADVKEKSLQRLATKGVVQLFNAVSKAQKRLKETAELTGNRAKAAKLGKASFLAELKNSKTSGGEAALVPSGPITARQQQHPHQKGQTAAQQRGGNTGDDSDEDAAQWEVLQEGFTGLKGSGKMKDWDRAGSESEEEGGPQELEHSDGGDSDW